MDTKRRCLEAPYPRSLNHEMNRHVVSNKWDGMSTAAESQKRAQTPLTPPQAQAHVAFIRDITQNATEPFCEGGRKSLPYIELPHYSFPLLYTTILEGLSGMQRQGRDGEQTHDCEATRSPC